MTPRDLPTVVGPVRIDHREPAVAELLVALQRAAYAVEAGLVGSDAIPPLHETVGDVRALDLDVLAFTVASRPVAAIGFRTGEVVDIDRLMVHPARARRGLGRRLVDSVLAAHPDRAATVSTGRDNLPARALYEGLGFTAIADIEVVPGLVVSRYERSAG